MDYYVKYALIVLYDFVNLNHVEGIIMNRNQRAQDFCQRRLNERKNAQLKNEEHIIQCAEVLFDWVLDLMENPTPNNTSDEVYLRKSKNGCILLGYIGEITDKPFDTDVMRVLEKMFRELGYRCFLESDPRFKSEYMTICIL